VCLELGVLANGGAQWDAQRTPLVDARVVVLENPLRGGAPCDATVPSLCAPEEVAKQELVLPAADPIGAGMGTDGAGCFVAAAFCGVSEFHDQTLCGAYYLFPASNDQFLFGHFAGIFLERTIGIRKSTIAIIIIILDSGTTVMWVKIRDGVIGSFVIDHSRRNGSFFFVVPCPILKDTWQRRVVFFGCLTDLEGHRGFIEGRYDVV